MTHPGEESLAPQADAVKVRPRRWRTFGMGFLLGVVSTIVVLVIVVALLITKAKHDISQRLAVMEGSATATPAGPLPSPQAVDIVEVGRRWRLDDWSWKVAQPDGRVVRAETFRGRPIFLHFWSTTCVPCRAELGALERVAPYYKQRGIEFLLISDESSRVVTAWATKNNIELPLYTAASPRPAYLIPPGVPATMLLTRDGEVMYSHLGAVDWSSQAAANLLSSLLPADTSHGPAEAAEPGR